MASSSALSPAPAERPTLPGLTQVTAQIDAEGPRHGATTASSAREYTLPSPVAIPSFNFSLPAHTDSLLSHSGPMTSAAVDVSLSNGAPGTSANHALVWPNVGHRSSSRRYRLPPSRSLSRNLTSNMDLDTPSAVSSRASSATKRTFAESGVDGSESEGITSDAESSGAPYDEVDERVKRLRRLSNRSLREGSPMPDVPTPIVRLRRPYPPMSISPLPPIARLEDLSRISISPGSGSPGSRPVLPRNATAVTPPELTPPLPRVYDDGGSSEEEVDEMDIEINFPAPRALAWASAPRPADVARAEETPGERIVRRAQERDENLRSLREALRSPSAIPLPPRPSRETLLGNLDLRRQSRFEDFTTPPSVAAPFPGAPRFPGDLQETSRYLRPRSPPAPSGPFRPSRFQTPPFAATDSSRDASSGPSPSTSNRPWGDVRETGEEEDAIHRPGSLRGRMRGPTRARNEAWLTRGLPGAMPFVDSLTSSPRRSRRVDVLPPPSYTSRLRTNAPSSSARREPTGPPMPVRPIANPVRNDLDLPVTTQDIDNVDRLSRSLAEDVVALRRQFEALERRRRGEPPQSSPQTQPPQPRSPPLLTREEEERRQQSTVLPRPLTLGDDSGSVPLPGRWDDYGGGMRPRAPPPAPTDSGEGSSTASPPPGRDMAARVAHNRAQAAAMRARAAATRAAAVQAQIDRLSDPNEQVRFDPFGVHAARRAAADYERTAGPIPPHGDYASPFHYDASGVPPRHGPAVPAGIPRSPPSPPPGFEARRRRERAADSLALHHEAFEFGDLSARAAALADRYPQAGGDTSPPPPRPPMAFAPFTDRRQREIDALTRAGQRLLDEAGALHDVLLLDGDDAVDAFLDGRSFFPLPADGPADPVYGEDLTRRLTEQRQARTVARARVAAMVARDTWGPGAGAGIGVGGAGLGVGLGATPGSRSIASDPRNYMPDFDWDYDALTALGQHLGEVRRRTATAAELAADQTFTSVPAAVVMASGEPHCPICLMEYDVDDELKRLKCSHAYHGSCIENWLTEGQNSCPTCRAPAVRTAVPSLATPVIPGFL